MYIIPRSIAQFAFIENINHFFFPAGEKNIDDMEYGLRKLGAVCTAGFVTLLFAYPFDLVKTRLSLEFAKSKFDKQFTGIFNTLGETRRKSGFRGLYRGFLLANVTNIPYYLTLFSTLQAFKFVNYTEDANLQQIIQYMAPASIAGLVSTIVVYPLDTIKRRIQMIGYNGNQITQSNWNCFKNAWQKDGLIGLYKGLSVTTVKFAGSAALQPVLVSYYSQQKNSKPMY